MPEREAERLAALRTYAILDTAPEAAFDDLTRLAAQTCEAPIALISLVDERRQWSKSCYGAALREIPREHAFCAHALAGPDLLVVPDAAADPRFAANPLVTSPPNIRFYAGAPLRTPEGHTIGTLCVADRVARELRAEQREALRVLARHVMALLELRRRSHELSEEAMRVSLATMEETIEHRTAELRETSRRLRSAEAGRRQAEEQIRTYADLVRNMHIALYVWRLEEPSDPESFRLIAASAASTSATGLDVDDILGRRIGEAFPHLIDSGIAQGCAEVVRSGEARDLDELRLGEESGTASFFAVRAFPLPESCVGVVFENVTDRRLMEEAQRASEERLRTLVMNVPVVLFAIDREGVFTMSEGKGLAVLGAEPGEVVGRSVFDVYARYPNVVRNFQRAMAGEEFTDTVELAGHAFETFYAPARCPDGSRSGAIGVAFDVTALRESEERYRALADTSPVGIWQSAPDGRTLLMNPAMCALLEIDSPAEMEGKTYRDFFAPESIEVVQREHARRLQGTSSSYEVEIRGARGGRRHAVVCGAPLLGPGGELQSMIATVTDVTALKAAEAALRESERRFRHLWENSPDAIFVEDCAGTVLDVNPAACRLHGMSRDTLIGRNVLELVPPEQRSEMAVRFPQQVQRGSQSIEGMSWTADGRGVPVEIRTTAIDYEGKPALLLHVRDVTERLGLEQQLRQAQKLEAIGQLAGGVAHDFNNILTVIQGHASLLEAEHGIPSSSLDSVHQIAHAAERAATLTRQLLTFSRQQIAQPKSLDLNEIVSQMTRMLRRILGEDITVQFHYSPGLPLIYADPGMLEQVLLNLVVNSRDAMPRGGKLTIETSIEKIDEARARDNPEVSAGRVVCLRVSDTGSGIPQEDLPHIFEPFFTTKEVGRGTGLGLATVYGIVKQHRGWIEVSSVVGAGTTFSVFLPATELQPEPSGEADAEPEVRGGDETILLVEDEAPVRSLAQSILERYGYRVLAAESGRKALELYRRQRRSIQLLLTDVVMPDGMSGRELAERLKADNPELRVVFSSGYSLDIFGKDLRLAEGVNFLQKPYDLRTLARIVRDCLDVPS